MGRHKKTFLGRSKELKELREFISEQRAGFVYVRGRRRVGKSRLLKELADTERQVFYFQGAKDSSAARILKDFASAVDDFSKKCAGVKKTSLADLKSSALSWRRIFEELTQWVRSEKKAFTFIFDEIQWIATTRTGCVGAIKEAWLDWDKLGMKVILCGSSNRFFQTQTGGEEKILRGVRTRSDIWIHPFTLGETKRYFFPAWTNEEVALVYMMVGGLPYYLERIAEQGIHQGFTHCINDAIFSRKGIFLQEINELLSLEFNKRGLGTVHQVLSCLGQEGKTFAEIIKSTGFGKPNLEKIIDTLLDFQLIFKKTVAHQKKKNDAGARFYMKDFYLNFYFQVLLPNRYRIEKNEKGFIFDTIFIFNRNYYAPNFSGKAFELLARTILENKEMTPNIFSQLILKDENFGVLDYWTKETQIDLLIEHKTDRLSRIVECKWIGEGNESLNDYIKEVLGKIYIPPPTYGRKHVLVLSQSPTPRENERAQAKGVVIVDLDDLF